MRIGEPGAAKCIRPGAHLQVLGAARCPLQPYKCRPGVHLVVPGAAKCRPDAHLEVLGAAKCKPGACAPAGARCSQVQAWPGAHLAVPGAAM